jgi:hypothetical protein
MQIPKTSRQEMADIIVAKLDEIRAKFTYKNGNYGADDDAFFNFRSTSHRVLNDDSAEGMYRALMVYMDKHLCALSKNGLADKEFEDRNEDTIVYSLIAIAMRRLAR